MTTGQIWSKFTLPNINRIVYGPLQLYYTKKHSVYKTLEGNNYKRSKVDRFTDSDNNLKCICADNY